MAIWTILVKGGGNSAKRSSHIIGFSKAKFQLPNSLKNWAKTFKALLPLGLEEGNWAYQGNFLRIPLYFGETSWLVEVTQDWVLTGTLGENFGSDWIFLQNGFGTFTNLFLEGFGGKNKFGRGF